MSSEEKQEPRQPDHRRSRRRLLICLMAPVLGLFATEGYVRIAGLRALPMPRAKGSLFADVQHPILMFVNRPKAKKVITYDDGPGKRWSITMRTNTQRFRGQEVEQDKPKGTLRIACLGDSHTWGDGVEAEEAWPAQLQALVEPTVEVLNCGVNGYDTMQEVLWYERYVEPFDPDLVLLAYFANDVAARGLGPRTSKVKNDRISAWTHPRRTGPIRFLREHLVVVDLLCDRVYRLRSLQARQDSWDSRYTEDDPGWKRVREALLRLRDRCARDGREFRVILFPYLVPTGDVFESHLVLEITAEFCKANGIDCLDGEPALLAALEDGDPDGLRVSSSDFHANGKAYAVLADSVAKWLVASGTQGFK